MGEHDQAARAALAITNERAGRAGVHDQITPPSEPAALTLEDEAGATLKVAYVGYRQASDGRQEHIFSTAFLSANGNRTSHDAVVLYGDFDMEAAVDEARQECKDFFDVQEDQDQDA